MNRVAHGKNRIRLLSQGGLAWAAAAVVGLSANALAAVRLPAVIGDHMVLQQGCRVPIWGWAEPGEAVTVALAGQEKSAKADAAGT